VGARAPAGVKVGLLTASASRRAAGVWVGVARLGKALLESGIDVEIFGIADRWTATDCAGWDGPPLRLHDVIGSEAFGYAPRLGRALHERRPSLLHANGLWMYPSLAGWRWSRRACRPYLVSPHGMLDPWAVRHALWKKRLVGWWFENAHLAGAACLHALTESEARAIRAYGLTNPICVVPNGVDLPMQTVLPRPAWADTAEQDRKFLLFLGRLHPKKGLEALIRAWKDVQSIPAARDWILVIAGWDQGAHARRLERIAEELGIAGSLRFVGPQFEQAKAATFACADAFVLPSLSEGLPVAVLEAWSYGLPVLMSEACNLPEGFAAGAALPIATDPAGIAGGLRRLFALSDAERRDMGARGRALVRARFTWASVGAQMAAVYRWVLGGGPGPSCVLTH
jgi:glycosyltransferase involved in cell wall biosynthesis